MNALSDHPDGTRGSRGFIVVAVLWILAALAALVLIYLTYVTNTAFTVANATARVQSEAALQGAVELAAYQLGAVRSEQRPYGGTFTARMGTARLSVDFRTEAARIDLNAAPRELLAGLMVGLGAAPANAGGYADRIVAWRTSAAAGEDDTEDLLYRNAGYTYVPRHAPFPAAEELWLVQGIPPQLIERMLPVLTVFSNLASVNIAEAAPQVLAALPGMTPEKLQALLQERRDPRTDPSLLAERGGGAASNMVSKAYRLALTADFDDGRRSAAEVVILLLEDGDELYRVLSWRDVSDRAPTQQAGLR
ncbi:type II secretion system protein GspK [Tardiphaga sp.]|uniref:general secretion pathway protein GspK n=1 Tax=Tardiphaga sp. TaxID=1926292 RepID=UPI00262D6802|nr:type II secretion system protein GspK [Tardiphaga sp.]MDB5617780.1 ral secretion pathway protein [Tardiphaga sp.]